jgi:hypothetical protein
MYTGYQMLFNQTCNIYRKSETVNSKNQKVYGSPELIAENVPCRLIEKKQYGWTGEKLENYFESVLMIEYLTDIKFEDFITINSNKYHIDWISKDPGGSKHHMEVYLKNTEV